MISYRKADLIDRIKDQYKYIVVGIDTSVIVKQEHDHSFGYMLQFTAPIVWPKYQGKTQITEEELQNIKAAIRNEYRNDPIYIGKQTIVNNDEGEFIEDPDSIIDALNSIPHRVGQTLDDMGYNIEKIITDSSALEVNFKVLT